MRKIVAVIVLVVIAIAAVFVTYPRNADEEIKKSNAIFEKYGLDTESEDFISGLSGKSVSSLNSLKAELASAENHFFFLKKPQKVVDFLEKNISIVNLELNLRKIEALNAEIDKHFPDYCGVLDLLRQRDELNANSLRLLEKEMERESAPPELETYVLYLREENQKMEANYLDLQEICGGEGQ